MPSSASFISTVLIKEPSWERATKVTTTCKHHEEINYSLFDNISVIECYEIQINTITIRLKMNYRDIISRLMVSLTNLNLKWDIQKLH